jgi:hypothetical protein
MNNSNDVYNAKSPRFHTDPNRVQETAKCVQEAANCVQDSAARVIKGRLIQLCDATERLEKNAYAKLGVVMVDAKEKEPAGRLDCRSFPELFEEYDQIISCIYTTIEQVNDIINRVDI